MLRTLTFGPKSVWFKVHIFNFWFQILNFRSKCLNLGSRSHFKLPSRSCQSQVWNFRSQALHFTSQIPKPLASTEVRICQPGSLQVPVYQRMESPPTRRPLRPWRAPAKVPFPRFSSTPGQVPSCRPRSTPALGQVLVNTPLHKCIHGRSFKSVVCAVPSAQSLSPRSLCTKLYDPGS